MLANVLTELEVQKVYLATEMQTANLKQLQVVHELLPDVPVEFIPHEDMKARLSDAHAFVRTGEMTPYANIILESGVIF